MHDDAIDTPDTPEEEQRVELPPSRLRRNRPRSKWRSLIEWIVAIGGAFLLAVVIQTFLFQPFRIPSGSMIHTLEVGDRIVVNKLSYRFGDVERGDVIVFTSPTCEAAAKPDWATCGAVGNYADLVKRVVGLPGDRLAIADGKVYVDGEPLEESYVREGSVTVAQPPYGCGFDGTMEDPYVVPDDMVFVMGDNRNESMDSRCFGPIPESSVVGRAFVIIWPFGRIGGL